MRLLPFLLPIALFGPSAFAQNKINDVVLKKDGARVRGLEITEFLLSGVRAKRGDAAVEIPAHQVLAVEWSEPPEQFVAGRAAMERGNFQAATQLFGAVTSERPLVKADAEFFMLKSAVASIGNDKSAAATAAQRAKAWLAANPNHWRTPEALLLAGRAERLAGTGGAAATTLKELDDRATREGFGTIWSVRAKYELALTLLADGKASEARTQFQSAFTAANNATTNGADGADAEELKALKVAARVGEGETYLAEKDYAKAADFFRGLVTGNEAGLVAAGHAGEGEALFLAAAAKPAGEATRADEIRRAQMSLARASVLDAASGEVSAKANYYLGRCMLELGPEREGDAFKQRANAYFQVVATAYPATRWAALAKLEATK